jgi:hypothetical protein
MADLKPVGIKVEVGMIIRMYSGEWMTPHRIWEELQRLAPEIAAKINYKVATYKDPQRNNAVWFITNTFTYMDKTEFERSTVEAHPEMKAPGVWEIIRKQSDQQ